MSGKMSSTRHFAPWAAVSKKARNENAAKKRDGISPKRLAHFWNYWQLLASRPIIYRPKGRMKSICPG